jgi:hypothetical protein
MAAAAEQTQQFDFNWNIAEAQFEPTPDIMLARGRFDMTALHQKARTLINGRQEIQHDTWEMEPDQNARTSIMEELTATGHISVIEFDEDVDSVNQKTLRRLLNGWNDKLPEWEKERRFSEIVEEMIIHQTLEEIRAGELPEDTNINTASDYPESANPNMVIDHDTVWQIGYRSLNRKGMTRQTYFQKNEQGKWRRVVEQVSRSSSHDKSSGRLLHSIDPSLRPDLASNEALGMQILGTRREFPNGAISFQQKLDSLAGPNIRYGEDITQNARHLPEYKDLRYISAEREERVERFIKQLADFEREVDKRYKTGRITYDQKLREMRREQEKIVDKICLVNPAYAVDARGEESARHYELAHMAMVAGHDDIARQHFAKAQHTKDPRAGAACGGIGVDEQQAAGLSQEGDEMYDEAKEQVSLSGKIRCFKCREQVNKKEVVKKDTWCCPKCKYEVNVCTGKIENSGNKVTRLKNLAVGLGKKAMQLVAGHKAKDKTRDHK